VVQHVGVVDHGLARAVDEDVAAGVERDGQHPLGPVVSPCEPRARVSLLETTPLLMQ
jgi:hypothetical protein